MRSPPRLVIVQGLGIPQHADPGGNLSTALLSVAGQIHQLDGSAEVFLPENATVLSATS